MHECFYNAEVTVFVPGDDWKINLRLGLIKDRKTSKIQKWFLVSFFVALYGRMLLVTVLRNALGNACKINKEGGMC